MTADYLISQLLEAVEVGDDGVYLKPRCFDNEENEHYFDIIHPVHGRVGFIEGKHNPINNSFDIDMVHVGGHPNSKSQRHRPMHPRYDSENTQHRDTYSGMSRTFVRSALKSLMQHIPNLETITGHNRVTGTHAIARDRTNTDNMADTFIRIPKSMRKSV